MEWNGSSIGSGLILMNIFADFAWIANKYWRNNNPIQVCVHSRQQTETENSWQAETLNNRSILFISTRSGVCLCEYNMSIKRINIHLNPVTIHLHSTSTISIWKRITDQNLKWSEVKWSPRRGSPCKRVSQVDYSRDDHKFYVITPTTIVLI